MIYHTAPPEYWTEAPHTERPEDSEAVAYPQTRTIRHNGAPLEIPGLSRIGQCYGCGRKVDYWMQQEHGGCTTCIRKAEAKRQAV